MSGKIYKITDNTNGCVYYGSTTMGLDDRLNKHKYAYNSFLKHGGAKSTSCEIIKNDNYFIELVEEVDNLDNLKNRERFYIENNECVNQQMPARSQKERSSDWYLKNKELCKERARVWEENNSDRHKQKKREWTENNKEYIAEYKREWLEKNRDEVNKRRRERRAEKKNNNTI